MAEQQPRPTPPNGPTVLDRLVAEMLGAQLLEILKMRADLMELRQRLDAQVEAETGKVIRYEATPQRVRVRTGRNATKTKGGE
jgi:hypothetical protein